MIANVRCVNYYTAEDEQIIKAENEPFRTRNILLEIGADVGDQQVIAELWPPPDLLRVNDMPLGVEDIRLFTVDGALWASGTVVQCHKDKWAEILVAYIPSTLTMSCWRICKVVGARRHQKNWSPIIWTLRPQRFIYSHDPFQLFGEGLQFGHSDPPVAAHTWSGSTQAIPFDAGHLVIVHEKAYQPELKITRRRYQQRFAYYDREWNLRKISRRFEFNNGETEFPCGMCWHPDSDKLVITYGVLDREAWIATVKTDEVGAMLYNVGGD
jgi:hypothetical protein